MQFIYYTIYAQCTKAVGESIVFQRRYIENTAVFFNTNIPGIISWEIMQELIAKTTFTRIQHQLQYPEAASNCNVRTGWVRVSRIAAAFLNN